LGDKDKRTFKPSLKPEVNMTNNQAIVLSICKLAPITLPIGMYFYLLNSLSALSF